MWIYISLLDHLCRLQIPTAPFHPSIGIDLSMYRAGIGCFIAHSRPRCVYLPGWLQPNTSLGNWRGAGRLPVILFCVAHLLICTGYAETNSGPDTTDQVISLVKELALTNEKCQKETSSRLKYIQTNVTEIKGGSPSLKTSCKLSTTCGKMSRAWLLRCRKRMPNYRALNRYSLNKQTYSLTI